MKAKVIATGETVEVVDKIYQISGNIYYEDIETKKHYDADELKPFHKIDWEQRRFELVKAALQGFLASDIDDKYPADSVAEWSIEYADAVIAKLKEDK